MCIGSGCLSNDVKNDIEISETNVMKILGIYFGKNKKECETLKEKVQKIIETLNLWRQRHLTVQGRAVVINTLLMSKLW